MSAYLYGVHDAFGAAIVPTGGWCVALASRRKEDTQEIEAAKK